MKNLRELRERAKACTKRDYQVIMLGAADRLDKALDHLWRDPSAENLKDVNMLWAFAHKLYKEAPPEADPHAPLAGAPEAARLAA